MICPGWRLSVSEFRDGNKLFPPTLSSRDLSTECVSGECCYYNLFLESLLLLILQKQAPTQSHQLGAFKS